MKNNFDKCKECIKAVIRLNPSVCKDKLDKCYWIPDYIPEEQVQKFIELNIEKYDSI